MPEIDVSDFDQILVKCFPEKENVKLLKRNS